MQPWNPVLDTIGVGNELYCSGFVPPKKYVKWNHNLRVYLGICNIAWSQYLFIDVYAKI